MHEGGHLLSQSLWKDTAKEKMWENAIKGDGKNYPSKYAEVSKGEDFSESLVMYTLSKRTACEKYAKELYPNRYKELDKLLGSK